ncbi:MAG: CRTAC1 family protein [Myxococcales bacterium]|nr:CRTAC1 family protein [Myxococcales bacterium]
MRLFTLAIGVIFLLLGASASADEVTIQYDDGTAEGQLQGLVTGDIEAFRLSTDHPATLLRLQLQLDGGDLGGDTEVHLWSEYGGNNLDLDGDLITPIALSVAPGVDWYEFDVSAAAIEIEPWWNFHVGIVHLQDGEPLVPLDTDTITPEIRTEYYSVADDTWYYAGTDAGSYAYMIRAVVDYHDQIDPADKPFQDDTDAAGLPRTNARPAWADYDNDGDPDLLLAGSLLYRNNGDGTFTDVTEAAGLAGLPGSGGLWADFDNDGNLDIYVATSAYEVYYNHILRNNGDGTFADITLTAFGGEELLNYESTEGLGLGDYDRDGYVDVYAGAYERESLGACPFDKFFRNNGDLTFVDRTADLGFKDDMFQCARGVQWIDFDNDGDADIHVSNYRLDPNFLWVNPGDGGKFVNEAEERGLAGDTTGDPVYYGHTIGSAWGDLDLDGDFDVVDANLAHPRFIDFSDKTQVLLSNGAPDFGFADVRGDVGVRYIETHSNPNLIDVDNDGDLDLYITDVYVGYKSQLYLNRLVEEGSLRFELYNYQGGILVDNGWGSAWADYDGDGDLDLYSYGLWRNDFPAGNWLKVKAVGQKANRAAIGARLTLEANGKTYLREIQAGSGTTTQDDLIAHFGLNEATVVDRLTVAFPGGSTEVLEDIPVNQTITVTDTAAPDADDDDDNDSHDDDQSPGPSGDDDDNDDDDSGCGC